MKSDTQMKYGSIWFDWRPFHWIELVGSTRHRFEICIIGIVLFNDAVRFHFGLAYLELNWRWLIYKRMIKGGKVE